MAGEANQGGGQPGTDRASAICRAIRRAILERALAPGDKLPEDQLGERFGVSRTLARHALGQLASEGLVELRRNRIAVVATPSLEDARDEFDIRIELEGLVVRRLAGHLSARQIAELAAHVDAEEAARSGPDAASLRLATEFHVKLAEMTGRPTLSRYVRETAYRSCLSLAAFGRPHSPDCAISEHREVLEALEAGNGSRAGELMSHHLEQVAQRALLKAPEARGDLMDILAPYAKMEEATSLRGSRNGSGR